MNEGAGELSVSKTLFYMETGKTDTRSRMDLPNGCWLEMKCNRKIYEKQGK